MRRDENASLVKSHFHNRVAQLAECRSPKPKVEGSIPSMVAKIFGAIAQLVEHLPEEEGVLGSIPSRTTINQQTTHSDGVVKKLST